MSNSPEWQQKQLLELVPLSRPLSHPSMMIQKTPVFERKGSAGI
jgi:hypothetical protein